MFSIIHASVCSAIDFPPYMSHHLFAYKIGRLQTTGGALMTKFYVRQLFNKHWLVHDAVSLHALPSLYVLSAVWKNTFDVYCICQKGLFTVFTRVQLICESIRIRFYPLVHQMLVYVLNKGGKISHFQSFFCSTVNIEKCTFAIIIMLM